jgi:hypothetical protein
MRGAKMHSVAALDEEGTEFVCKARNFKKMLHAMGVGSGEVTIS